MSAPSSPWIRQPLPRPDARLRLFCIAFGGGGAGAFRTWPKRLPPEVEVLSVQLPGREDRLGEPTVEQWDPLVEELGREAERFLDRPFAFFGHSMGGMISFELTKRWRDAGAKLPEKLLVSAVLPPQMYLQPRFHMSHLSDDDFLRLSSELYGSPMDVLGDPKARERTLPVLRADVRLVERYYHRPAPPLPVPLSAFAGTEDIAVPTSCLEGWREHTTREFHAHALPGGHFFLFGSRELLLQKVVGELGLTKG